MQCQYCGKSFIFNWRLVKHEAICEERPTYVKLTQPFDDLSHLSKTYSPFGPSYLDAHPGDALPPKAMPLSPPPERAVMGGAIGVGGSWPQWDVTSQPIGTGTTTCTPTDSGTSCSDSSTSSTSSTD